MLIKAIADTAVDNANISLPTLPFENRNAPVAIDTMTARNSTGSSIEASIAMVR